MDSQEIWRPIVCQDIHEGWYEVSNKGRVRSASTKRLLSPFLSKGYMRIGLMTYERHQQKFPVHRLVAMAFVEGYSEERHFVNHINGDKLCNEAHNLEWVTASENTIHAIKTGLLEIVRGERNGAATITEKTVIALCILLLKHNGYVPAAKYDYLDQTGEDVTLGHIYHLRQKSTWLHVTDNFFDNDLWKEEQTISVCDENGVIHITDHVAPAMYYIYETTHNMSFSEIREQIYQRKTMIGNAIVKYY